MAFVTFAMVSSKNLAAAEPATAENLRKQATGQEIIKVRIEDGRAEEIMNALHRIRSVDTVEWVDKALNRFEVQSNAGQSSKREIFQLCVQQGWVLSELIPQETRLEDIFRNLTMN
jgi:ABC-2 type transport system ATP-binding protein